MLRTLLRYGTEVFESGGLYRAGFRASAPPRLARSQPPNDACPLESAASTSTNDCQNFPPELSHLQKDTRIRSCNAQVSTVAA